MAIVVPVKRIGSGAITSALGEFTPSDQIDAGILTGAVAASVTVPWAQLTGVPATFPPDPHTHAYSSLTGIPSTFAPSAHTHPSVDITSPISFAQLPVGSGVWDVGSGNVLGLARPLALDPAMKINLDGVSGAGDTYIVNPSGDVIDFYSGGVHTMRSNVALLRLGVGVVAAIGGPGSTAGASVGELVLGNNMYLRASNAASSTTSKLIGLDVNSIVQIGEPGTGQFASLGGRPAASLNAGQSALDGCVTQDTTNNRLVYYSGGNRYYLTGTAF